MSNNFQPIDAPGRFVPIAALSFGGLGEMATQVTPQSPLPVAVMPGTSAIPPLAGSSAISQQVGPFSPEPGRTVMLTLSGSWTGKVTLLRSTDSGVTRLPATIAGTPIAYHGNLQEAVWSDSEAGAGLWLDLTLDGGTVTYRVSQ